MVQPLVMQMIASDFIYCLVNCAKENCIGEIRVRILPGISITGTWMFNDSNDGY